MTGATANGIVTDFGDSGAPVYYPYMFVFDHLAIHDNWKIRTAIAFQDVDR